MGSNKTKLRIGLIGSKGRLGSAIKSIIESEFAASVEVSHAIDRKTVTSLAKQVRKANVFLDVSMPEATERYLSDLLKENASIPYVVGCTGWSDAQLKVVHKYAKRACVVLAPNFSPAVNLFLGLIEQAAPKLARWGYDVVVHETHHRHKKDSPSGTAKAVVERLSPLKPQVHASRAGAIVGTHEVRFIGSGDILRFEHEALDRVIFARGAVMAADWASRQASPGLYSMKDVVFGSD